MRYVEAFVRWVAAERWRASVGHGVIGLLLQFAVVLLGGTLWTGFAVATAWYWSHERTQHVYQLKGAAPTIGFWNRGWWPGEWEHYAQLELAVPAGLTFLAAVTF